MTECESPREALTVRARVDGRDCEVCLERSWFGWKRLPRGRTGEKRCHRFLDRACTCIRIFVTGCSWVYLVRWLTGSRDEHVQLSDVVAALPSRRGICLDKSIRTCPPQHTELTLYEARRKAPYNRAVQPIVVEFSDADICQRWCRRLQAALAGTDCDLQYLQLL